VWRQIQDFIDYAGIALSFSRRLGEGACVPAFYNLNRTTKKPAISDRLFNFRILFSYPSNYTLPAGGRASLASII
jgi:hypothetical protein